MGICYFLHKNNPQIYTVRMLYLYISNVYYNAYFVLFKSQNTYYSVIIFTLVQLYYYLFDNPEKYSGFSSQFFHMH